jgi:hypothetical protein
VHADDQDAVEAAETAARVAGDESDGSTGDGSDGSTGDAAVDEALGRLAELDRLPVREHVGVFDAVHAALQDRLADVED